MYTVAESPSYFDQRVEDFITMDNGQLSDFRDGLAIQEELEQGVFITQLNILYDFGAHCVLLEVKMSQYSNTVVRLLERAEQWTRMC